MKTVHACMSCLIDDLVGAVDLLGLPPETARAVIARGFDYLARTLASPEGWDFPPGRHITALHRILKEETGLALPFAELRDACNRVGIEIAARRKAAMKGTEGPARFRDLVRWAIAGNHLDFRTVGTGYGFSSDRIEAWLAEIAEEPLAVDDVDAIREILERSREVLFVPDNVGEIALDALLVDEIRSMGCRVLVPYRGGPITSDATLEDFRAVGLDSVADEIFEAGPDTLGISFEEMSPRLAEAFKSADAVITKGQANYYAVSERLDEIPGAVAVLLRTKCDPASKPLGAKARTNVAALLKRGP